MKQDIEITDDQVIGMAMLGAFLTAYGSVRLTEGAVNSARDAVTDATQAIKDVVGSSGGAGSLLITMAEEGIKYTPKGAIRDALFGGD